MLPFITQFRVEKGLNGRCRALIAYAHINHNDIRYNPLAEITNNLNGDLVGRGFTKEPQISGGLELFFYNWDKVSFLGS